MNRRIDQMTDMALGAGLMYVFDPERGRRRRMLFRKQAVRQWHKAMDTLAGKADETRVRIGERAGDVVPSAKYYLLRKLSEDEAMLQHMQRRLGKTVLPTGSQRRSARFAQGSGWIGTLVLGAGLMYFLDPEQGSGRRAWLSDQSTRFWRQMLDALTAAAGDLSNRAGDMVPVAHFGGNEGAVDDEALVERVRSAIGRAVSHPGSISVSSDHGHITLSGPILSEEIDRLLTYVSSVRGVAGIENRLEEHHEPGDVPGLQGGNGRRQIEPELWRDNWSPGVRLLVAAAGGMLTVTGLRLRGAAGYAGSALGLGLLARGITNLQVKRLLGLGSGQGVVGAAKTIEIAAPVEEVFEFWRNYGNIAAFLSHVQEVRDGGNGRSHWVVQGPAGASLAWDTVTTRLVPNKVLAWKSLPGSAIPNAGVVRLQSTPGGSTQVHVQISYHPPAGASGHGAAAFFGSNPKGALDADLDRLKSLIEQGRAGPGRPRAAKSPAAGEASHRPPESQAELLCL